MQVRGPPVALMQLNFRQQARARFALIARLWERGLTGGGCAEQLSGRTSRIELIQGRDEPSFLPLEMRFENRRQAINLASGLRSRTLASSGNASSKKTAVLLPDE
jgi:hypothetical protein